MRKKIKIVMLLCATVVMTTACENKNSTNESQSEHIYANEFRPIEVNEAIKSTEETKQETQKQETVAETSESTDESVENSEKAQEYTEETQETTEETIEPENKTTFEREEAFGENTVSKYTDKVTTGDKFNLQGQIITPCVIERIDELADEYGYTTCAILDNGEEADDWSEVQNFTDYVVMLDYDIYEMRYYNGEGVTSTQDKTGRLAHIYIPAEEDIEWDD